MFDNFSQGANDRVSARALGRFLDAGGRYNGAFPRLHNVDRSAGALRPRGGECKINPSALSGDVLGVFARPMIEANPQYPAASHPEVLLVAVAYSGVTKIGLMIPTATTPTLQWICTIGGAGPCEFVDLGKHVLAFNGTDCIAIRMTADNPGGTWSIASGGVTTVTGDAWQYVTSRWFYGGVVFFKSDATWYGPYWADATASTPNIVGLTDPGGGAYTGPTGAITNVMFIQTEEARIAGGLDSDAPPQPQVTVHGAAGVGAGPLSGNYQWCFTFVTDEGDEGNPGLWSNLTAFNEQNAIVWKIPNGDYLSYAKINIYRRGGANGENAILVDTLDLDSSNLAANARITKLNGAINDSVTTIPVTAGTLANWPTVGVFLLPGNSGATPNEYVEYGGRTDNQFTSCVRDADKHAWDSLTLLTLVSLYDDNADSDLVGAALRTDRAWVTGYYPGIAAKIGERFYAVRPTTKRLQISSIESWRYFADQNPAQVADLDDDWTGGYLDIGADSDPITAIAPGPNGEVVVFKRRKVFIVTGKALWSMHVTEVPGVTGTTSPRAVIVAPGLVGWLSGSKYWLWDGTQFVDVGDPMRGSLGLISNAYAANAVAFYWDSRFHLLYPTDATGNIKYIGWDSRYAIAYEGGKIGPSAVTADGFAANCVSVSNVRAPEGIVYAGLGAYVYAILGTGSSPYTYAQAGSPAPALVIQTPDVPVGDGSIEARIESWIANVWTPAAFSGAGNASVVRRFDSIDQTTITTAIPTTTGALMQGIHKSLTADKLGAYLGLSVSIPLSVLVSGSNTRQIESLAFTTAGARRRPPK
jgi:hypothetical protein